MWISWAVFIIFLSLFFITHIHLFSSFYTISKQSCKPEMNTVLDVGAMNEICVSATMSADMVEPFNIKKDR
jgi:hypothetical protein